MTLSLVMCNCNVLEADVSKRAAPDKRSANYFYCVGRSRAIKMSFFMRERHNFGVSLLSSHGHAQLSAPVLSVVSRCLLLFCTISLCRFHFFRL